MKDIIPADNIESRIHEIRGYRVIMDADLAEIYGVPTRSLNQAVRRNQKRFPADFVFQLSRAEMDHWKSQFVTSKPSLKMGFRKLPYAFTEHGAIMAANILKSDRAIQMSVFVVRAFVRIRSAMGERRELAKLLATLEKKLTLRLDTHETAIIDVLQRVMRFLEPPPMPVTPRRRIGFRSKRLP
jgi:hypothetical protein